METGDGFIPIVAIFYAVFHPTEGTKIVHQVPEGSILTTKKQAKEDEEEYDDDDDDADVVTLEVQPESEGGEIDESSCLFNFDTVKNYVIPKPQLCNKLISFKISKFKVIGYPVNIENSHYSRNSFNFNFCFVFPYESGEVKPYELAIKRIGKMFQVLEEQSFLLSKLDKDGSFFKEKKQDDMTFSISNLVWQAKENIVTSTPGHSKTKKITLSSIESLIHQIYQDLNNYSECCIPLDSANSVDIKLFPILPPPVNIKAYQVPVSTVKLNSLVDVNWDPTMLKILPYINGINSIKRISELSNSNYLLTKQCIQHLMHYKCIEISDIFQFGNIYAPTNHIGDFLASNGRMAEECQSYVITQESIASSNLPSQVATPASMPTSSQSVSGSTSYSMSPLTKSYLRQIPGNSTKIAVPSKSVLFYLYRSLNQGQTVKEWFVQHRKLLANIDIRRFIHFGILRGILYRVYSYPILDSIVRAVQNEDTAEYDGLIENMKTQRLEEKRQKKKKHRRSQRRKQLMKEEDLRKVNGPPSLVIPQRKVSFSAKENKKVDYLLGSDGSDFDGGSSNNSDEDDDDYDDNEPVADYYRRTNASDEEPEDHSEGEEKEDKFSNSSSEESDEDSSEQEMVDLFKMLKGYQHFDAINTELHKSRAEVEQLINSLGKISIINS